MQLEEDEHDLEKLAFVSYSSGTTGKPKGIANPHRAPVRSYDLRFALAGVGPGDRVACNVYFIWEMMRPLLRGATVVAVPDSASYDPVALVDFLAKYDITETLMTPTLMATVLARHPHIAKRLPLFRTMWLNGEVVTTDLAKQAISAMPGVKLMNCYSASETHEIACGNIAEMMDDDEQVVPVGRLIDPERMHVLDEAGEPVCAGVSGELYVGGDLLARGYLNLPEVTNKSFVMQKTSSGMERMYKTGDLARILPSGLVEITGRVGSMIKIRGYSVQPGAVVSAVVKHLAVQACAILAHGDGLERQLVGYVVPDGKATDGRPALVIDESGYSPLARKTLAPHLAHYMIPALWVEMDELPSHEVSGKIDLKSLPPPPEAAGPSESTSESATNTPIDMDAIRELWAASLNLPITNISSEHSFFDLGGHSLTLADLASRVTRSLGIAVQVGRLAEDPTLQGHLDLVQSARDGDIAAVQADLPAVIKEDATLPDDIRPTGTPSMRRIRDAKTIFLTGTTGFLGAFLLDTLLRETTATIICLVRFPDPSPALRPKGMARLRKHLVNFSLWNDSILNRIEILPANVGLPHFGLGHEDYAALVARAEVIIHAAATVNLVYSYAAMRAPNIFGTREVLRLASQGGSTVHYISTNGVLPPSSEGWAEDTRISMEDVPTKLADGYGQTKWVAEELVLEAAQRGIPARVYRPGTLSGHSATGAVNEWDLLTAIVVESLNIGYAPGIDGWLAEMTPVDFASRAIVALCDVTDGAQHLYHIGDPRPVTARHIFESLHNLGYPTTQLPWDEWKKVWLSRRGSGKIGEDAFTTDILRGGMPSPEFLKAVTVLNDDATRPFLTKCGLVRPAIDERLLETYARDFFARGWLSAPPTRSLASGVTPTQGPLAGQVAVITGASSGIGLAIARAVAGQGAAVALAARRLDALEGVVDELRAQGHRALAVKTDITSSAQVNALVKTTTETLGPPDILISCAGVMYFTLMANTHADEWDRTVDVNCKGLLHCLSATLPTFISRGKGHVVAISSDAGRKVFPGLAVYSGSKFFVEATLQGLRVELAGTGVKVTSVQPGNVDTGLAGMATDQEAVRRFGEPSGARVLDAGDVAGAVVFALVQGAHVGVNEVLIEPRDEPA